MNRIQIFLNPNNEKDALLIVFLETKGAGKLNSYVKNILEKVRTGKLIDGDAEDLQRKKTLVDIELKEVMILIKRQELIYKQTFEQTPPQRHKEVMKIHIENQNLTHGVSIIDEKNNRIMCAECGSCFVFAEDQRDKQESKQAYIDHYVKKHGLKLPDDIQKELNEF